MTCDVEVMHVTTGTWRYDSTWPKRAALRRARDLSLRQRYYARVVDRLGRVVADHHEVDR